MHLWGCHKRAGPTYKPSNSFIRPQHGKLLFSEATSSIKWSVFIWEIDFFFNPRWELKNYFTSFFASIDYCAVLSLFGRVRLFVTPQTVARPVPLSIGFSRQECWSGLPSPPPGDLPDPGIEPSSLKSPALAGGFFTTGATWEAKQNQI